MTAAIPSSLHAIITELLRQRIEFAHIPDGHNTLIDARWQGHHMITTITPAGHVRTTLNGQRIHGHKTVREIRRNT